MKKSKNMLLIHSPHLANSTFENLTFILGTGVGWGEGYGVSKISNPSIKNPNATTVLCTIGFRLSECW